MRPFRPPYTLQYEPTGPRGQNRYLKKVKEKKMKRMLAVMLTLLCASPIFAYYNDDALVRWKNIGGVITAPGVDNPVAGMRAGAGPWVVRNGRASVDLNSGHTSFEVEGLVLNGGNASGTPGP